MPELEFLDRNVVPGSTNYVDLGMFLAWQKQDELLYGRLF